MVALVIEDNPLVAGVFRTVLDIHGFVVIPAATAEAGFRLCSDPGAAIDLVVVDRLLPDARGTDVAHKILAHRPEVQILLTSGTPIEYLDTADLSTIAALPKGSYSFLQKPCTAQGMMEVVEELLNRKPALAMAEV